MKSLSYGKVKDRILNKIELNSEIEVFNYIVERKKKKSETLLQAREEISNDYKSYLNNINSVYKIMNSRACYSGIKKELIDCYNNNTAVIVKIRNEILTEFPICPYCGLNEADTLDHYLEKSNYPEYAVLLANLVPCCTACNRKKSADVYKDFTIQIVYFYADFMMNEEVLIARIDFYDNTNIPSIRFELKESEIKSEQSKIYIKHVKNLELLKRYSRCVTEYVDELIRLCKNSYIKNIGIEKLREIIQSKYKFLLNRYGLNHYKVALYAAVLRNDEFILKYYK